jgi:hypothetical protein
MVSVVGRSQRRVHLLPEAIGMTSEPTRFGNPAAAGSFTADFCSKRQPQKVISIETSFLLTPF